MPKRKGRSRKTKKTHRKGGRGSRPSGGLRNPPTDYQRQEGIEDRKVGKFKYAELPTIRFNVASQCQSVYYTMNTMGALFTGGSPSIIPGWANAGVGGFTIPYRMYRVLRSRIVVKLTNRDVIPFEAVLYVSNSATALVSNADFTAQQSNPHSRKGQCQIPSGGPSILTLKMSFDPSRMFGKQYGVQDQYAALPPTTDPATLLYWGIGVFGAGAFTVTTGGVWCQVTLHQTVEVYQPDYNTSLALELPPGFVRHPDFPNQMIRSTSQSLLIAPERRLRCGVPDLRVRSVQHL